MGFLKRLIGEEPGLFQQIVHSGDKGHFGEYLTEYALNNYNIKGYGKTLHNIYVPYRGKTSEIDVLLIHEKGFFVFESKNYAGWIFGDTEQKNWTQVLPNKQKSHFYNPILQNKTHINALSKFLEMEPNKFRSYIIFSERCELKKVPEDTESYFIVRRPNMLKWLRKELETKETIYTKEQIDEYYNILYPLTQVTQEEKQKHIDEIKENHPK
ncbi:MAG: nuclease-related domain-containing protein [bacterium]